MKVITGIVAVGAGIGRRPRLASAAAVLFSLADGVKFMLRAVTTCSWSD